MSRNLIGKKMKATTVQGQNIKIEAINGVAINDANLVTAEADIGTSNSVIHVIDNIILPN